MPKATGPTPRARSKKYQESLGCIVVPVEQMVKFPDFKKRRCPACGQQPSISILKDAFNFGDLLYAGQGEIGLIQATTTGNQQKRVNKILDTKEAQTWLENGGKILVDGWAKQGSQGSRKLWTLTRQEISLGDLETESNDPQECPVKAPGSRFKASPGPEGTQIPARGSNRVKGTQDSLF